MKRHDAKPKGSFARVSRKKPREPRLNEHGKLIVGLMFCDMLLGAFRARPELGARDRRCLKRAQAKIKKAIRDF